MRKGDVPASSRNYILTNCKYKRKITLWPKILNRSDLYASAVPMMGCIDSLSTPDRCS